MIKSFLLTDNTYISGESAIIFDRILKGWTSKVEFSNEEPQSDDEIREDIFRLALDRLGHKKDPVASNSRLKRAPPDHRRRRFVQEGQVIVERQALTRVGDRATGGHLDDHPDEISRLRAALRQEQRRADDASKEVNDLKNQYRTLETHVAHDKFHIKELAATVEGHEKKLHEAELTIRRLEVENRDLCRRLELSSLTVPKIKKVQRAGPQARKLPLAQEVPSQKPVRWWKD